MEKKRERQEAPQNPMEMLIQSSQQHMNAMLLLVENISEELSYRENIHRETSIDIFDCILLICRLVH